MEQSEPNENLRFDNCVPNALLYFLVEYFENNPILTREQFSKFWENITIQWQKADAEAKEPNCIQLFLGKFECAVCHIQKLNKFLGISSSTGNFKLKICLDCLEEK